MKKLDLARFQKSRESTIESGPFKFIIRRPSPLDVARIGAEDRGIDFDFACRYVVGWEGVKESDLLPGGDPEPLEFDHALCLAWIADHQEHWQPIASGVIKAFRAFEEASENRGNV